MKPADEPVALGLDVPEAESRFRAAFEAAPVGMAVLSLDGRFLQVNDALCRLVDRPAEALVGTSWRDVVEPADHAGLESFHRDAVNGGAETFQSEIRYVRPDGTAVWAFLSRSIVRDVAGTPAYFISQAVDISKRKLAESQRNRQAEELGALHETTLDLIRRLEPTSLLHALLTRAAALMRTEHAYVYVVNDAARELEVAAGIGMFREYLGYRLRLGEGLAGRVWELGEPLAVDDYHTWSGRRPEFEMIHAAVALPLRAGNDVVGVIGLVHLEEGATFRPEEVDLLTRFGRLASIALENARLYDAAQQELRERRRAEKELERYTSDLRHANEELRVADELKSHFVAVASHELRTPLTSVLGFSSTLLKHWDRIPDETKREHLAVVESQARRLSKLADELLTMSKIESGAVDLRTEPVSLLLAVQHVVEAYGPRCEIRVAVDEETVVRADAHHVQQIIANYVANAVRHGKPPVRIEATCDDGWVEVRVRDQGPGVPAEFVPRLFEKFAQARTTEGGTGLGLSIVRGLARAHGGEAWYEPDDPAGACFGVRLPAG